MNNSFDEVKSRRLAVDIRVESLKMVHRARSSHIGGALSMADILAVLYGNILHVDPGNPQMESRDRFLLSKGHSCVGVYSALALCGFFPLDELEDFGKDGSRMMTHISHKLPGVEFSTGSLGHALPFGCGKALAGKRDGKDWRVFVILSDGEMDEGSNWEAMLFAPQHKLDNLVAVIDYNKIQSLGTVSEVMELDPLADKLKAFRWAVREVDGHDHEEIQKSLSTVPWEPGKPSCLIANTVKGKGVDFMENKLLWHYKPPNEDQLQSALSQIDGKK